MFNFIKKIIVLFIVGLITHVSVVQAKIVTSVKPIGFIAEAIGHNVIDTEILLPDGASAHTYSLKPSDLVRLKSAELIIWIGEDMESFLPGILKGIDNKKQLELSTDYRIKALLRGEDAHDREEHENDEADDHDHHHGQFDMHIWLSPKIAKIIAKIIHDKLEEIYPEKSAVLNENLSNFIDELRETEQIIAKQLNNVQNKGYFVFHDAYGYFETEFGLNNLGSFTINPSIQPGLKKVYEVQSELRSKQAICIFREPQFSPAIIAKLVDGTNVKIGELDPLGIDVMLSKDSYCKFLLKITQQFLNCLE